MPAAAGLEPRRPSIPLQVAQRVVADQHDVTATATIAAVWPALWHVRLATEAQAAITSGAGLHIDARAIPH
jgi:hypothetical protein